MSPFKCPICLGYNIRTQGPPLYWEFDADGPVQFSYDDDLGAIPMEGRSICNDCGFESGTWRFHVG